MRRGALLFAVVLAFVPSTPAHAQTPSISVTPATEVQVRAGGNATDSFSVTNGSDTALHLFGDVVDLSPASNGGFAAAAAGSTSDSAASWVTINPAVIDVPPGGSTSVSANVHAPVTAPVGGHYAGIRFSTSKGGAGPVHALLIELEGEGLRRAGKLLGLTMPAFEINGELPFHVSVQNTGNTHLAVDGTITVRDRLRGRTAATLTVPKFYVLPGRTATYTVLWNDPPRFLFARASAQLVLLRTVTGEPDFTGVSSASGVVVHYYVLALLAFAALALRVLLAIVGRKRRKAKPKQKKKRPAKPPVPVAAPVELPPPLEVPIPQAAAPPPAPVVQPPARRAPKPAGRQRSTPAASAKRSAWEVAPPRTTGALAVRRARTALRMIATGAGTTGVRIEVALGLLRSVREAPGVADEVEAAYADAGRRGAVKESAALALALQEIDSAGAAEALLRGYAKADKVLAVRLKKALAQCDPADLRGHPDLLDALPVGRRSSLPIG